MKKTVCLPLFWLLLALAFAAHAQDLAPGGSQTALTLARAIDTALTHNAAITASRHRVEGAGERIALARSGFFPQINVGEAFSRTTNPMWAFGTKLNQEVIAQSDFDPQRLNDPAAIDNFATVFSATWPVFDAGQTWYGWQQAKMGHRAAVAGADRLRQQVIAMTVEAFTGVVLAKQSLATISQALASARSHVEMVQDRFQSGLAVKSDLLRAQVHIAQLTQQELDARSRAAVAMAGLAAVMGRPDRTDGEPSPVADAPAAVDGDTDAWIATAKDHRPDLKAFRLQEQIAEEEVRKAKAAFLPSVNLTGNYEINSEQFSGSGENYTVGAMVNLNLFAGNRFAAKHREAVAALAETRAMVRGLAQQIEVETRQAFSAAQSAAARIAVAQTATDQAAESQAIVSSRYKNGLLTIVDLLDAETALHQARTARIQAVHDLVVAKARLLLAAGLLDKDFK